MGSQSVVRERKASGLGTPGYASLLSTDDVVLLVSSSHDLQRAPEGFEAECEAAWMKVSSSKSEAMIINRKKYSL